MKMGGIAGSTTSRAYSILVAAGCQVMEDDQGDWLVYSGSDAHDNKDPAKPKVSGSTQCVRRSIATGRPVRVLRSFLGKSVWAPKRGNQYDGLYTVVREITDINKKGGAYLKYRLNRNNQQPAIALARPTGPERSQESRVEDGY